jgi:hypothetical protein
LNFLFPDISGQLSGQLYGNSVHFRPLFLATTRRRRGASLSRHLDLSISRPLDLSISRSLDLSISRICRFELDLLDVNICNARVARLARWRWDCVYVCVRAGPIITRHHHHRTRRSSNGLCDCLFVYSTNVPCCSGKCTTSCSSRPTCTHHSCSHISTSTDKPHKMRDTSPHTKYIVGVPATAVYEFHDETLPSKSSSSSSSSFATDCASVYVLATLACLSWTWLGTWRCVFYCDSHL